MNKVSDVYTPEVSRHKLSVRFGDNLPMIEAIRHMNNSNLCVFAALCDGHTVTTTGYDIPADFWVNRASAVACSLKQLYLPIETQTIQTKADVGGTTKEGANKQVMSSQADSLIKISRIWADFFPANTSNQPI